VPDLSFSALLIVLLSPAIGSFLTVLIDRLPRGQSIVWPGSACRACGTGLGPRDLVPVLSFALHRGRCRHCTTQIPPWHLYVEITAIGAAVIMVALGGSALDMALGVVTLWLLLVLAVTDLLWFRLPDPLTGALALCALTLAATEARLIPALWAAAIGSGAFWAIRAGYAAWRGREGLGMGDVKLMAGLGALVGPWDLPLLVLLASGVALGTAMARIAATRQPLRADHPLPFGAALSAAGAVMWLMAQIVN
jgi:leader peptidase (prepilin peptidase)/N-methyltransferase